MAQLPKLPIGIQTFDEIRREGYLYVDKTKYLIDLIDRGKVYFLSRPRRFGKSLTISTFDALFSGRRNLFEGLYAEEFMDRQDYKTHPVIRLDMSNLTTGMGIDVLRSSIIGQLKENAERLETEIDSAAPGDALFGLIRRAAEKHGAPAVVLVDEYDSPILRFLHSPEKAREIREILHDFYIRIKAADAYLRFVFITGISKFSKMGVFSAMNNLIDISMNDRYAAMLGYTEEELLTCFDAYIGDTAAWLGESRENLSAGIRGYYDGFSFDGKTRLYNPFSVLNFFNDPAFKNYWFESGTPSALAEYVKRHDLEVESFRGLEVSENFTSVSEIEQAPPESFLFQSGYLSVREKRGRKLILDYPNMEVLSSVADLFLWNKAEASVTGAASVDLEEFLARGDAEGLVRIYDSLLASIPYDIYEREEQKYAREREKGYVPALYAESFYHSLLFTLIWASRVKTTAENHSYWGRSDIEAEKNGYRYVVELKVAEGEEAAKKAADEAMAQIRKKGYADKHAHTEATLIAIAVDRERRRVGGYRIERL
jgi:hypothetical protein